MVESDDAALLRSVEREMARRRRQLRIFLGLSAAPLVVALGFLLFGRDGVADLEPLRAKVAAVDETLSGARAEVGALSSTVEGLSGLEDSLRDVERERVEVRERLDALGKDLDAGLRGIRQDQSLVEDKLAQQLELSRVREEMFQGFRTNLASVRELAASGGHGDPAALEELRAGLGREIEELRNLVRESGNRAGARGNIVARMAPSADYPACVRIDLDGDTKALPGDTGVVRRHGRYCGLVTVIDVKRGAVLAVIHRETVGRNGVEDGDTVQFHVR